MTLDDAIRAAVREALAAELPKLLAAELGRERLIPLDATNVNRRVLLTAARAGEITIYRRGQSAFVRAEELERWILAAPDARSVAAVEPGDEIGELVELGDRRRRKRG